MEFSNTPRLYNIFWHISFQVVVSKTFDRNNINGGLLGEYSGDMPVDQKFDITYAAGYIRGRWITIVNDQPSSSLTVAEVRVYGSKHIAPAVINSLLTHSKLMRC